MKKILFVLSLSLFLVNCQTKKDVIDPKNGVPEEPTINLSGSFVSGAHSTSGSASVNSEKTELSLSNFKTSIGPKLLVYLTTTVGSSEYVSLGALKGTDGNYNYTIPKNTDLNKYKIVDIWCVDFSVSFGHAELK